MIVFRIFWIVTKGSAEASLGGGVAGGGGGRWRTTRGVGVADAGEEETTEGVDFCHDCFVFLKND